MVDEDNSLEQLEMSHTNYNKHALQRKQRNTPQEEDPNIY